MRRDVRDFNLLQYLTPNPGESDRPADHPFDVSRCAVVEKVSAEIVERAPWKKNRFARVRRAQGPDQVASAQQSRYTDAFAEKRIANRDNLERQAGRCRNLGRHLAERRSDQVTARECYPLGA